MRDATKPAATTARPCRVAPATDTEWGPLTLSLAELTPGTLRLTATLRDGEVYYMVDASGPRAALCVYRVAREMGCGAADLRAAFGK